jgi:AcrR family transcriptional regulator
MVKASENQPNLKVRLLEVAVELLSKPGKVKLPTMRELATNAGVAPGAAYRHFSSQDELFLSVIVHLHKQLEQTLLETAVGSTNPHERLKNFAQAYVAWGLQNPGAYQLMFETTDDEKFLEVGMRPGLHLIYQTASLITGQDQPSDDAVKMATQIWASLHGIVSLRTHKSGMPWLESPEAQVDRLLSSF